MIICSKLADFERAMCQLPKDCEIGFVPTMGALHNGHVSLVKKALKRTKYVIVSIFVNPTQFNNPMDLEKYPRTLEEDCNKLEQAGAYLVFAPGTHEIYPDTHSKQFDLGGLDKYGEGPSRPGHFNGVAQVVTRLFDIVKPTFAVFGQKDFQQLAIIKHLVQSLGYNTQIVTGNTVREKDGLAMSSRNMLLTKGQREAAPLIYKTLRKASAMAAQNLCSPNELCKWVIEQIDSNPLLETEYAQILDGSSLIPATSWQGHKELQLCVAVNAKPVRLIDNIKIK